MKSEAPDLPRKVPKSTIWAVIFVSVGEFEAIIVS